MQTNSSTFTPLKQDRLQAHFNQIMARRGAKVPFERFEADSVRCDSNRLHLDVISVASGAKTLVFVPGTSVYGLLFGDFLAAVADEGVNVVSVDPRGHGQSQGERGSYTISELVRDTRAAVAYARERFGGSVFVAGSSQGGLVAFYLAATDEEVAGVICHNLADLSDPDRFRITAYPTLARLASFLLVTAARFFPEQKIKMSHYLNLLSKQHQNIKARLATDPLALQEISFKALASLASAQLEQAVERITTPILVLHGAKDTIFPQDYIEHLYQRLTCRKAIRVYPERDHFLLTERPQEVIGDILSWIQEIEV